METAPRRRTRNISLFSAVTNLIGTVVGVAAGQLEPPCPEGSGDWDMTRAGGGISFPLMVISVILFFKLRTGLARFSVAKRAAIYTTLFVAIVGGSVVLTQNIGDLHYSLTNTVGQGCIG